MLTNQYELCKVMDLLATMQLEPYKIEYRDKTATSMIVRVPAEQAEKLNTLSQNGWKYNGQYKMRIPENTIGIKGWQAPEIYSVYQCMIFRFVTSYRTI